MRAYLYARCPRFPPLACGVIRVDQCVLELNGDDGGVEEEVEVGSGGWKWRLEVDGGGDGDGDGAH